MEDYKKYLTKNFKFHGYYRDQFTYKFKNVVIHGKINEDNYSTLDVVMKLDQLIHCFSSYEIDKW